MLADDINSEIATGVKDVLGKDGIADGIVVIIALESLFERKVKSNDV